MDPFFERRLIDVQNGQISFNSTPQKSPVSGTFADRFIPVRSKAVWKINFDVQDNKSSSKRSNTASSSQQQNNNSPINNNNINNNNNTNEKADIENSTSGANSAYCCLLKNELLGSEFNDVRSFDHHPTLSDHHPPSSPSLSSISRDILQTRKESKNLFQYQLSENSYSSCNTSPYSLSPIGQKSQQLLCSPRRLARKIPKIPYKVLDAPELQDDFYLNLVDWSSQNMLAVGLGSCLYLWNACTSQVTRLCDLSSENDTVTSVSWNEKGNHVAVGSFTGSTQIWDVQASKRLSKITKHSTRVGAMAWNGDMLASGSRDRSILLRDTRDGVVGGVEKRWTEHKQEVCGLKWSPDKQYLASGGNDNKLILWSTHSNSPVHVFNDHLAAVKAIAWSPHQHGLLASGGGTADRRIRFWNTLTLRSIQSVDTASQVCNLAWSKHSNELVSTHGYSQNQILIWKYPSLHKIAKLTGHTLRVLYLASSPDGESIVTGAGDETLRFWNVFSKSQTRKEINSALNLFTKIR